MTRLISSSTVERTLLDFNKRFCVQKVLFDPYMLHPVMQRLAREGIDVEEFPQTTGNLTDASQNLFEVIRGRNIVVYPAADIRLAISRAIAIETQPRLANREGPAKSQDRRRRRARDGRARLRACSERIFVRHLDALGRVGVLRPMNASHGQLLRIPDALSI